jgi:hypothetical protein
LRNRGDKRNMTLNKGASDFNSKIYKDIFPPPKEKFRNTISPIYFESNLKRCKSNTEGDLNVNIAEEKENELNNDLNIENEKKICNTDGNYENFSYQDSTSDLNNYFTNKSNSEEINNFERSTSKGIEYELKCEKTGEDIRRSYIAKLIYKKVWQPTIKEKDHNTLIIFDWDDTLLCTSFLTPNGVFSEDTRISEKDMEKIKKLEISSEKILKLAIEKGDTYIITNAAPGWVEYSASRFYPGVAKLLKKVTIVSARGEYEKKFPGDSRQWKILAFLEMLKILDSNLVTNLICLGDSIIEMEAAHILASKFSQAYIKTIKFREAPKPEELNKQLNLVIEQFPKIFSAVKNLTIRVEKKSKEIKSEK